MADPTRLSDLGRVLREEADARVQPEMIQRARRDFLERGREPRRNARGPLLAVAALAVAVVLVVIAWPRSPEPGLLAFEVGSPPRTGVVGEWLAAPVDGAVPMTFSEGTQLELEPQSRLRVREVRSDGAQVVLEKGTLRADVVPTDQGQPSWLFEAGPFSVAVKGTSFSTSWDPATDTFAIAMKEGRVVVQGPVLETPRELVGGDRLRVSVADRHVQLSRGTPPEAEAASPPATEARVESPSGEDADEEPADAEPAASATATAKTSWRERARAGDYRAAMEQLDDGRFGALVTGSSQADLFFLADAARFGGRPDRAKSALLSARKRFGSSRAAFLLGKVAADQLRSPAEASQWFQIYVREAPSGALAEQAWGRLLELSRGGDPERVRALAQEYLSRFPNGGHAPLARQLVGP